MTVKRSKKLKEKTTEELCMITTKLNAIMIKLTQIERNIDSMKKYINKTHKTIEEAFWENVKK